MPWSDFAPDTERPILHETKQQPPWNFFLIFSFSLVRNEGKMEGKKKKSEIQHEQQICNLGFVSEANVLL